MEAYTPEELEFIHSANALAQAARPLRNLNEKMQATSNYIRHVIIHAPIWRRVKFAESRDEFYHFVNNMQLEFRVLVENNEVNTYNMLKHTCDQYRRDFPLDN